MDPLALSHAADLARPHLLAVALCAARLAPAAFLSPLLGGQAAPPTVRLSVALCLSLFVHFGLGVEPGLAPDAPVFDIGAAFARELWCGVAMGYVAALPFDAARMAGRFLDTFRGANAEAVLPATGSREAATGDFLYQLLCAVVFAGPLYRMAVGSLVASFAAAPLGLAVGPSTGAAMEVALTRALAALSAALAIGAPAAAVSLVVDLAVGIAGRVSPALSVRELGPPARLMLGAAAILLTLGTASARLVEEVASASAMLEPVARAAGGTP
jgi:type III secretion protein T